MQRVIAHDSSLYDVWEGRYAHSGYFAHFTGIFTDKNGEPLKSTDGQVDVWVELDKDWPHAGDHGQVREKESLVKLAYPAWLLEPSYDDEEFCGIGNLDVSFCTGDTYQIFDWECEDREERVSGISYYDEHLRERFTFTSPVTYVCK